MKACVRVAQKKFEVKELPIPELVESDDVLLKVGATGICGSDLHMWLRNDPTKDGVIFGHEFSGTVVKSASGNIPAGTRCAVYPGSVKPEVRGAEITDWVPGIRHIPGAYEEYLIVKERYVHQLPDTMSLTTGALLEPLGVAYRACLSGKVQIGQKVLVEGTGVIGTGLCAWLKAAGAGLVVQTEISDTRMKALKDKTDADYLIDAKDENLKEKLLEISKGGFDVTFDCANASEETVEIAMDAAKVGGRVVVVGVNIHKTPIDTYKLMYKPLTLTSSFGPYPYERLIPLVEKGLIDTEKFVTNVISLNQVQENFELLTSGNSKDLKVIIDPSL